MYKCDPIEDGSVVELALGRFTSEWSYTQTYPIIQLINAINLNLKNLSSKVTIPSSDIAKPARYHGTECRTHQEHRHGARIYPRQEDVSGSPAPFVVIGVVEELLYELLWKKRERDTLEFRL